MIKNTIRVQKLNNVKRNTIKNTASVQNLKKIIVILKKIIIILVITFFCRVLKSAERRNKIKLKKPFTITKEYLKEIFPKNKICPVLGIEFKVNRKTGGRDNSASLDRIDNDKGYEIGNVIWVCMKVNQIKTTATPDEIIKVGEFYKKLLEERS